MDDRLVLARTVGVFDAGLHYRAELRRLDQRHRQRMDYWLGAVMFGVLFGVFTLLAYIVGGVA